MMKLKIKTKMDKRNDSPYRWRYRYKAMDLNGIFFFVSVCKLQAANMQCKIGCQLKLNLKTLKMLGNFFKKFEKN